MEYNWIESEGLLSQVGIRSPNEFADKDNPVIVIIPGNPGLARFYEDFANRLYNQSGECCQIYVLSYLGAVARGPTQNKMFQNKEKYLLKGQIRHKINLINALVPKNRKIIIVGHSIGSYIMLNSLDALVAVHNVYSNNLI